MENLYSHLILTLYEIFFSFTITCRIGSPVDHLYVGNFTFQWIFFLFFCTPIFLLQSLMSVSWLRYVESAVDIYVQRNLTLSIPYPFALSLCYVSLYNTFWKMATRWFASIMESHCCDACRFSSLLLLMHKYALIFF